MSDKPDVRAIVPTTIREEALNKAAVFVLWYSAYKAGLYAYTATPANPVEN
jgi:hypothetical protein